MSCYLVSLYAIFNIEQTQSAFLKKMLRTKAKDRTSNSKIPIKEQHHELWQCKFIYTKLSSSADIDSLFYKGTVMYLPSFSITLAQKDIFV